MIKSRLTKDDENGEENMDIEDKIKLMCEPCEICGRVIPISIPKKDLVHSPTGVTTVVDLHGLDEKAKKAGHPDHVRILYVDEQNAVRSFSTVKSLARRSRK